jgi:hypothetical protein
MAPKLRISAGASVESLSVLHINDESKPLDIADEGCEGQIIVRIKNFTGELPSTDDSASHSDTPYFDHSYAKGCTWSIGIQGRFKDTVDVDDVEFGNLFDTPIKSILPYGTSAALKALSYIDPNLHHDLYADKPWAFSPLICTMTRVNVQQVAEAEGSKGWPAFPHGKDESDYIQEDTSVLLCKEGTGKVDTTLEEEGYADLSTLSSLRSSNDATQAPKNRVKFWGNERVRQAVQFNPRHVLTMDFCQGYIQFSDLHLQIAGMSFDLTKYWQSFRKPVRFVARNKSTEKIYFVVEFQLVAEDT